MKKALLLFLFSASISLTIKAQDTVSLHDGFQIFYYPNGNKSSEGTMKDGKPDGWWKSYNPQGVLVSEGNRRDFLLDSTWFFYNHEGKKTLELNYKKGKKEGQRIQYFEKEYTVENWHNDTLTGNVNTYHQNGILLRTTPYADGVPHGLEKSFDTLHHVIAIANYYHGVLTRRENINRTDLNGLKQGNWKYFWDNGNLKMEITYLNDKKNGFAKYYDENGQFLSVEKYENDQLISDAKETKSLTTKTAYHSNGQPSITATYFKNIPEGIRREYDTTGAIVKGYVFNDGVLRFEGITDLNGKRQGLWKEYYPTGELRSRGYYKNSNFTGEWKFFFTDGTVEIEGSYNNIGKKEGTWQWYYPDGSLLMTASYDNGALDGEFAEYDEDTTLLSKGNYAENAEEGEWFYKNGSMTEKGEYYDGMRTGRWISYFQNGTVAFDIHFEQDLMHGKYTSYRENGSIKLTGKYITGLRDGVWSQYDEEGTLVFTTLYKDGKEVKWNNYLIK